MTSHTDETLPQQNDAEGTTRILSSSPISDAGLVNLEPAAGLQSHVVAQHLSTESTRQIGQQNTHPDGAMASSARTPSPFYESMVQAADRIASGPVLDLAGSLGVESSRRSGSRPGGYNTARLPPSWYGDFSSRPEIISPSDNTVESQEQLPARHELLLRTVSQHRAWLDSRQEARLRNPAATSNPRDDSPPAPSFRRSYPDGNRDQARTLSTRENHSVSTSNQRGYTTAGDRSGEQATQADLSAARDALNTVVEGSVATNDRLSALQDTIRRGAAEVRRDLEQAFRDYRAARRALSHLNPDLYQSPEPPRAIDSYSSQWMGVQNRDVAADNDESILSRLSRGIPSDSLTADPTESAITRRLSVTQENPPSRTVPTARALRAARLSLNRESSEAADTDNGESTPTQGQQSHNTRGELAMQSHAEDDEPPRRSHEALIRRENRRPAPHRDQSIVPDGTDSDVTSTQRIRRNRIAALDDILARNIKAQAKATKSGEKAVKHLRYLTRLKQCGIVGTSDLPLAQKLVFESISNSLLNGKVADIPMRIDELPLPQISSWLEPGVSWHGQQSGGIRDRSESRNFTSGVLFAGRMEDASERILSMRARRHRERLREERREQNAQATNSRAEGALREGWMRLNGLSATERSQALADVERHLSDLLEEERQIQSGLRRLPDPLRTSSPSPNENNRKREETWPVKVTLYDVDWIKMTVSGIMAASHIPDPSISRVTDTATGDSTPESRSMESLFDGEIIDFRLHELETVANKTGYTIGGLDVDIQYWAGIGPFKEEIEYGKQKLQSEKLLNKTLSDNNNQSNTGDNDVSSPKEDDQDTSVWMGDIMRSRNKQDMQFDKEEEKELVDRVMARCLGSQKWINQNMERWILMRWKERCFAASSDPKPSRSTPVLRTRSIAEVQAQPSSFRYSSQDHNTLGLTISGFYYIALHRQTGRIEGLYYDPGSQPYQRLEMCPATGKIAATNSNSDDMSSKGESLGVRKEFPVYGFR